MKADIKVWYYKTKDNVLMASEAYCDIANEFAEQYAKEYYQSKCSHKVIEPNGLVYRFNNICEKCGKILNQ